MAPKLVLEFTKMTGAGNDFIVVDNRFYHFSGDELSGLARRLCTRRTGIGADGLLAFSMPRILDNDYRMQYYNADGSLGTMCGNGARCLARFARLAGLPMQPGADAYTFESDAGDYRAWAPEEAGAPVRLWVPAPTRFEASKPLAGYDGEAHYLWPGVEHLVLFVGDVAAAPVDTLGPQLRRDDALGAAGANVNFVQVSEADPGDGRPRLVVRTFEKGVEAETLACGTGAIASAVVARLTGRVAAAPVDVAMPGGLLTVGFRPDGEAAVADVYLEGPAEVVYRGTIEV